MDLSRKSLGLVPVICGDLTFLYVTNFAVVLLIAVLRGMRHPTGMRAAGHLALQLPQKQNIMLAALFGFGVWRGRLYQMCT